MEIFEAVAAVAQADVVGDQPQLHPYLNEDRHEIVLIAVSVGRLLGYLRVRISHVVTCHPDASQTRATLGKESRPKRRGTRTKATFPQMVGVATFQGSIDPPKVTILCT